MLFATFLIMLREGLEGALIVSIIAGYLQKTGHGAWMKYIWLGVFLALALCFVVAIGMIVLIGEMDQQKQEIFEALIAFLAVIVLTYMVFWMKNASHNIQSNLIEKMNAHLNNGKKQGVVLVGMAFFSVAREGVESIFFLLNFFQQETSHVQAFIGSFAGLIVAIVLGIGLYKGSIRLGIGQFFTYTSLFILFVAAGLLSSAFRSLHEAGLWNVLQTTAYDASSFFFAEHTLLGTLLSALFGYSDHPSYGEVLVYVLYLFPMLLLFFFSQSSIKERRTQYSAQ